MSGATLPVIAPVITIDCEYVEPQFAAAYLITEGKRAAFIDNNTAHAVPRLMEALEQTGLSPENVEYIVITHVHLDHAGGTSLLASLCPNARVLAHPRAVPHVVDPSRLVASARKVYGDQIFEKLYGDLRPISEARVRAIADGETLRLGSRPLEFFHTRGHANHHFCVYDSQAGAVFTGDAFGLTYPALQDQGLFSFPSTSPTDFDPKEALSSIDRIVATGARHAYPTHFGQVSDLASSREQLREHLNFSAELLDRAQARAESDTPLEPWCLSELQAHYQAWLKRHGRSFSPDQWRLIGMDLELNAAGICHVARKLREKKT